MAIRSRNKVSPNFNMSSMTDIVFLLLIFFMITSTLISPNALKMLLPSSSGKVLSKQSVSVSITSDLRYAVNGVEVTFEALEPMLQRELSNVDEASIILHADKTLELQEAVKVMDIANENKWKLVLATKPYK